MNGPAALPARHANRQVYDTQLSRKFGDLRAADELLHTPVEKLFTGPIADVTDVRGTNLDSAT
ncbi:MAG TPA: hypothetical protein VFL34_20125 [Candidatus Sulfotelmatobacter sp.]|nr:hypothetical protein [Candidatus Sulfotelmatobacter sp.]